MIREINKLKERASNLEARVANLTETLNALQSMYGQVSTKVTVHENKLKHFMQLAWKHDQEIKILKGEEIGSDPGEPQAVDKAKEPKEDKRT